MKNLCQTHVVSQPKIGASNIVDPSEKLYKTSEQMVINPSGKFDNLKLLTDQNLYQLCKAYGERTSLWRQKFAGLLPEVFRRKLYEKKGFGSIFEFAKKLAGMSEEQVRRVLNLEKRFENLPILQSLLVNGQVSANKLVRITSIATNENEKFLAEQVQILSQAAVETLVRDKKWADENQDQDGFLEPENEEKSVRTHTFLQSNSSESNGEKSQKNLNSQNLLKFSPEVQEKLLELQNKGIDINELLLEFLQKREGEITRKKEKISRKVLKKEAQTKKIKTGQIDEISKYVLEKPAILKNQSRNHMPIAVKKIIKEEYGTKCALKTCQKCAVNIHHTLPFSLSNSHDPKFLVPLCREHHELAHSIDANYHKMKYR